MRVCACACYTFFYRLLNLSAFMTCARVYLRCRKKNNSVCICARAFSICTLSLCVTPKVFACVTPPARPLPSLCEVLQFPTATLVSGYWYSVTRRTWLPAPRCFLLHGSVRAAERSALPAGFFVWLSSRRFSVPNAL